jgi:hypothetical protein
LSDALKAQRTYLAGHPQSEAAAALLHAQDTRNVEYYEEACHELARLEGLREALENRLAALGKVEAAAPA